MFDSRLPEPLPPRRQHERITRWLAAIKQHAAWLYAADEQYQYLEGEANELYQCGLVIELDTGGTLLLVEQIPRDFRP
ncbi:TPA: hypothetical protein ACLMYZ_005055 [Pseudomonas aeruginosa]|nr:hypothetical protein [Pseudomonas aeruginosa]MED5005427.1 hypothetical protein [Pseudomonas aeruginosa]